MKTIITLTIVAIATFFCISKTSAQCTPLPTLSVVNPSFEGTQQPHVTPGPWVNCHPGQTPDTQPGSWGITLPPTNGSSYLGLVHQPSSGWQEGASEALSSPMVAGTTYNFSIDLANSSSTGGGIDPGCAECQIWGSSNSECDQTVLLWSSGNITPFDVWQTYNVSITPTQNFPFISIYINSLNCSTQPYILVDNMTPIIPVNNVSAPTLINTPVTCGGGNNGIATVHATGLHPPFTFLWNSVPAQTDSVLDNVGAGTYTVTVTDANGCTATGSITMSLPAPVITPVTTNINCFGQNTGGVSITTTGGTGAINFAWSNGAGNVTSISSVVAGTYSVTATDALNCTSSVSVAVTQPLQLSVTANATNATCTVPGSLVANASGGIANYTYSWNTIPAQSTQTATNLGGGSYIVTVTDVNACTVSASFNVANPPNAPTINLTPTNPPCFGQSNGNVASTVSGGTPGYSYAWNTVPVQNSANAINLIAGTYVLTVTDAGLCSVSASVTLTEPTLLTANTTKVDVLCFGLNTGSATVTASGGTTNYSYSWNTTPVQTTATASSIPAGNYAVTVTDAHNCTVSSSLSVNQPLAPLAVTETHVNVLCFGNATGSASSTVSGGTTNYSYLWNTVPSQTTSALNSLIAGTYNLTVTDANNCTVSVSSVITQPATPVSVSSTIAAPLCFGQPSTSASSNATGGTPNYNYAWNTVPTQNTQNITNVPAGTFTVTATDANSCTATSSIVVSAPPTQLSVTTTHVDVLCFGDATGSITANASGSWGTYSYNWNSNPVQTTPIASQLIAGNYNLTVTDINGCTATATDIVSQPASALSISTSKVDVLCFGDATGSATVVAVGGTAGYNYLWSTTPQQTTPVINSIIAGTYNVTVLDANSCSQTANAIITQPATPLVAAKTSVDVDCNGANNGSISISATGGTVNYNYMWSVTPSVNTPNATGLPPGNYSITITDANSCSFAINNMTITEPTLLTVSPVVTNVSCPNHGDGAVDLNPNGGTPNYNYVWSNGGNNSPLNSNLSGGVYDVTVTDSHGCSLTRTSTVIELPGVFMNASVTNVLCFPLQNGAIDVTAGSSFMPLQYTWDNGAVTEDLFGLDTGTYHIIVTDSHNCVVDSVLHVSNDAIFSIDATPDTATINLGHSVTLNVVPNGSVFGTVLWTPSNGLSCSDCVSPISSTNESITYYVTGTDTNGCVAKDIVVVNVVPDYIAYIPNAFTPNGDGNNDFFEVFGNKEAWKQFDVEVYNRIGEKVFESNDMNFKWDGTYKGQMMNPTVLVYTIKVIYLNNYSDKLFKGTVTLIR